MRPTFDFDVAVVGAGISGLVAARALVRAGLDVVVLESADRAGGRMLAETSVLGSRLDLGGQWLGRDHHRFEALAAEAGATVFAMHTPKRPALVVGDADLSMAGPAALVAQGVLVLWEVRARLGAPERWRTLTVADWLRRVPNRRARRILEVLVSVASTADLDRLSMYAFASLIRHQGGLATMLATRGGAQESLLVEGAASLPEWVAGELGERVRLAARVNRIERDDDGATVHTASGAIRAGRVIVTVPPPVAARIEHDPPLPDARRALEQGTVMGTVHKAIAVYDEPFWRTSRRTAEVVLLDEPGCAVFDSSPPGGPGHLCFLLAGPEARALDDLDPAVRRTRLLAPLARRFGDRVLEPSGWHEKSWHLDEHAGGGYLALPLAGTDAGHLPVAADPIGPLHFGGAETAAEHAGYIEGAIEAGERVAAEVVRAMAASRP